MSRNLVALVLWPSAPFTESLVRKALSSLSLAVRIISSASEIDAAQLGNLLQFASYDAIEHELTISKHSSVLSSSYTFRKGLIRKHFLSRCIFSYLTKHPTSILKAAWPRTYEIEISFADELDELFADDLWELGEELQNAQKWWILKPGMADRGNGIRMFNDRATLEHILEEFEEQDDPEDDMKESTDSNHSVVLSQLRHFVIQEYVLCPLLLDPREVPIGDKAKPIQIQGYKFHLRAYCVASGAFTLYLYDRILALFSAAPYDTPKLQDTELNLAPHLTNTSLQTDLGEENVRLLDELIGCHILSKPGPDEDLALTSEDVSEITKQMAAVLAETFKAALENPINFQALPNAFELFGIDFLVSSDNTGLQVKLLEINAEPAIELTGPRLAWILEDLFVNIGKVCVEPFFSKSGDTPGTNWAVGETRRNLVKCLDTEVRSFS